MSAAGTHPRDVVITGRGVLSPLGDRPETLHHALCEGESGLCPVDLFDTADLPVKEAAEIRFEPRDYLPEGNLRPLDRTGRLVIAAAQLALDDAGWSTEARAEHAVGLVLGTMYGSVHTIASFDERALVAGPKYVKPFDFANSVINAAAGQTAIWHGLRGVNSTVAGGTAAGAQALAYAVETIRQGRADAVLAGGGEELSFESFFAFCRAGLLAGSRNGGPPRAVPFDRRRNGFALGEGAALLMLESAESAARRGARVLGRIRGQAAAFDVSRGTDDEVAARTVARTAELALEDAGAEPGELSAVCASASGALAGDRHEALGLARVLAGETPVTAIKGQHGEALGASGAVQTLVLLESFAQGRLPGIAGLGEVLEGAPAALAAEPRTLGDASLLGLVTAVGIDGNVCALVLEGSVDR